MSKLMDKMLKGTSLKYASVLSDSVIFAGKEIMAPTSIPALNIALSGELNGGLRPGLRMIAGDSKHFKTTFALIVIAAYLNKYQDAILLFYDSEFGAARKLFESCGIDSTRVLHVPITNIEEFKFDIMQKLDNKNDDGIKRGDKVIIFVDSIGNLASTREIENAISENSASDMTRAKELKSVWRMITPHLTLKDISLIAINHTYEEMKLYGRSVMSGGRGCMLSSDDVWFITKAQEKDGTEVIGYYFTIVIEKSRYVKERSKIPILVNFDGGISKYSGILDLAVEAGEVVKPKKGYYALVNKETGEIVSDTVKEKATGNSEFLGVVLNRESFKLWIQNRFKLSQGKMIADDSDSTDDLDDTE